jgi:hypothetical protein
MQSPVSLLAGTVITLSVAAPVAAQSMLTPATGATVRASGVAYTAGGVGLDARAEMQSQARPYNLLVMFAESSGEFLIPDAISVRRGNVDVLNVFDSGPLLYVNLPNGAYTVQATYHGVVRSKVVNVTGRMPDMLLTWPSQTN